MRGRRGGATVGAALALAGVMGCSGSRSGGATGTVPPLRIDPTAVAVSPAPTGPSETPSPAISTSAVTPALTPTPGGTATASSPVSIGVPPPTAVVPGTPAPGDYSDAAVVAAAKAYVLALAAGLRTGDEAPFLAVTSARCGCRNAFLPVFAKRRRDAVVTTFEPRVSNERISIRGAFTATVTLTSSSSDYDVIYRDGRKVRGGAGSINLELKLLVTDKRWLTVATQ